MYRSCACGGCEHQARFYLCLKSDGEYEICYGAEFKMEMRKCYNEERVCTTDDKYNVWIGRLYSLQCTQPCCNDFKLENGKCVINKYIPNNVLRYTDPDNMPDEAIELIKKTKILKNPNHATLFHASNFLVGILIISWSL
jgi:hypothetical protein